MAKPVITDFAPAAIVGPNTSGLNSYNSSQTEVIIRGDNMAYGLAVNATNSAGVNWSGTMGNYDNQQQGWPVILTCSNTSTGMGDTQNIDVIVGTAPDASDTTTFRGIAVASVQPIGPGPKK